jgi:hypothetical protein
VPRRAGRADSVMASTHRGSWIGSLYFYAAALIGLVFVLVGLTSGLQGAARASLPGVYYDGKCDYCDTKAQVRDHGIADVVSGFVFTGIGAPVLLWHLRQARRRDDDPEAGEV